MFKFLNICFLFITLSYLPSCHKFCYWFLIVLIEIYMQHLANTFEVLNFICYKNNNNLNDLCRDSTCLELDIINYITVLRFINVNCLMFQHILYAICLMTIQNLFRQIIFSHDIFPMKLYICPARNNYNANFLILYVH